MSDHSALALKIIAEENYQFLERITGITSSYLIRLRFKVSIVYRTNYHLLPDKKVNTSTIGFCDIFTGKLILKLFISF